MIDKAKFRQQMMLEDTLKKVIVDHLTSKYGSMMNVKVDVNLGDYSIGYYIDHGQSHSVVTQCTYRATGVSQVINKIPSKITKLLSEQTKSSKDNSSDCG